MFSRFLSLSCGVSECVTNPRGMAAFSGRQRAEFAVAAAHQLEQGLQSCLHPQVDTLARQLDAYYTVASFPQVTGVDTTFNNALPQVVLKAHARSGGVFFMCFPCASAKRRMYELTSIINMALARARRETSDPAEALVLCRAHAAELCASYAAEPTYAQVEEALRGGAAAAVWTPKEVVKLDFKPVLPGQFKRAFEQAGVAVCDTEGRWQHELRLLGAQPSMYVLGAKDGREELWANNKKEMVGASVHLHENKGVQESIKGGVVVYFE